MTGSRVKIENFAGQIPKRSNRLLGSSNARVAQNLKLDTGEMRGLRDWEVIHNFANPLVRKAYRLPDEASPGGFLWVGFIDPNISLFPGPLLNDGFDRYYKFGDGRPQFNTLERMRAGDPFYWLGIPEPILDPIVSPSGGTGADEERFYVYTLVNQYGEEGQPSAVTIAKTGKEDGSWEISNMDVTAPHPVEQPLETKNIYRTVVGFSSVEFFFVANVPLVQGSYTDTTPSDEVARNNLLESETWAEPPIGIEDAVVMPNGYFLAWDGRNIHFSETYRPWAWPAGYDLSTQYEVIGAGVFGQSAGIITEGHPYIATGVAPANVTLVKNNTAEPGLSKNSIVSLPYGVLYASQNGLAQLSAQGVTNPTKDLLTKDDWAKYSPETMISAQYENQYIGFYQSNLGIAIDPTDANNTFIELTHFYRVDYIQTDERTGEVYLIRSGVVYLWDSQNSERVPYKWRSRTYTFDKPCNMGAAVVDMENAASVLVDIEAIIVAAREFNVERIKFRLQPIATAPMGSSYKQPLPAPHDTDPQNRMSVGGSPLIDIQHILARNAFVRFNVYADGDLVFSEQVTDKKAFKLPAGFKNDVWEFEVQGQRVIYTIKVAETAKGLADV